jgi:predicted P-loop ATPase
MNIINLSTKRQETNWISNIGDLFGLKRQPNAIDIDVPLVADIAHEIVLIAGPDASYLKVKDRLEKLLYDALEGRDYNDVTDLFSDDFCTQSVTKPKREKQKEESMLTKLTKFLKVNYVFRYNVLTRESEMKHADSEDEEYVVIGKREQNTIVLEAQEAGITCWDKDVTRIIESTNTTTYHPFTEYFSNLPEWDGKDRVEELAKRVSEKELWVGSFHRWMLGVAAQWMNFHSESARANCVAPLLISTEQGWGKSTFCRMLLPKELRRYYTESFDLASQASCEKRLGNYGLINLDEFDKYSAKKMPILKNLMQEQALNVHLVYQKSDTTLHRIASFIGTSNRRDLLTDTTGSRRFICVELEKEIDCETPIEYAQLYAQLKAELISGERTYFTKEEEREIQQNNRPYYRSNPEEEAFHRHFRMAKRTDKGAEFMTANEIFTRLKREEKAVMRGVTAAKMAHLLPELGQRVHTNLGNGYYVVRTSLQTQQAE